VRRGIVASSADDLVDKLEAVAENETSASAGESRKLRVSPYSYHFIVAFDYSKIRH